jgi:HK97 family phage portal protein
MGFIQELRSSLENPQTPLSFPAEWLTDIYNGGRTDSGLRVSQMTALQIPVVFSAINIVSNGIAQLPLNVMEIALTDDTQRVTRKLAYDHQLQDLLYNRPHPEMSSFTWRKVMQIYALLWGNAYSEILLDGAGRMAALAPRAPWKTASVRLRRDVFIEGPDGAPVKYKKGTLVYKTTQGLSDEDVIADDSIRQGTDGSPSERFIAPERMLYIPGLTLDGRVGQDTVWLMRQCFGLALATEKFGAKFFGNGARPGGILELLGGTGNSSAIKDDQLDKARNSFQEATGGENMHRIFVTKGGTKFTPLATPNNDSQFLETRKHQREEIAAIFQVPLHMLGDVAGTNKATAEQLGQEFVSYTLGPWIPSWEQELKYKLFTLPNQNARGRNAGRTYEPRFDTHALLYPTADSKSNFYQKGKLSGWLNTNMILEYEGLNPISEEDGGEDFWQPVNVTVVGEEPVVVTNNPAAEKPAAEGDDKTPPPEQKGAPDFSNNIVAAIPLFNDAFTRYSKRKEPTLKDFQTTFSPVLESLRQGIKTVAAEDMGVDAPEAMPETDKFLSSYAEAMHKRATDFKVDGEVKRAVRAIAVAVYRELAVSKVKV